MPLHEWKSFETQDVLTDRVITWIFEQDSYSPIAKIKKDKQYSIINDHLGTPIEAYAADGKSIWERELNSNGKVLKEKGTIGTCPFLFQGQYYDEEVELAYNRFRYYDPEEGRYISQDPIGLLSGEFGFYNYVEDSNTEIDIFGLSSTVLNKALGGVSKDNMQAHHLIPEKVWNDNSSFLNEIGLSGQRDVASNGLLMHDSAQGAIDNNKAYYHNSRHDDYSKPIDRRVRAIQQRYEMHGDKARAKAEVGHLQRRLRNVLDRDSKSKKPRRVGYKK